ASRCARARAHTAARAEPGDRGAAGVRRCAEGTAGDLRAAAVQLRYARGGGLQPREGREARRGGAPVARDRSRRTAAGDLRLAALLPGYAVVDLLRARLVLAEHRDVHAVALEVAQRVQHGVLDFHARHDRPLVVAVGEVALRAVACEGLEEVDRIFAVRRILHHARARDVDVRAPARLVREHDAEALGDLLFIRLVGASEPRVVILVRHRDVALARRDGFQLV